MEETLKMHCLKLSGSGMLTASGNALYAAPAQLRA